MKPELWLNRADHELSLAKELLGAGTFLWAASYAHRSVEYALEGLIVLKTGERPERGSRLEDLLTLSRSYLPDTISPAVEDLTSLTPLVWKSDIKDEQIAFLTEKKTRKYIEAAEQAINWIGEEWERCTKSEPTPGV
jgi:HEPN domain-containing protein